MGFSLLVDDFQIIEFDPKNADESLIEKYLDWEEAVNKIWNPDEPVKDREAVLKLQRNRDPNYTTKSWVILSKQQSIVIGYSSVWISSQDNPNHDQLKHLAYCSITILPKYRWQGLGTWQLETCLTELKKHKDITTIQASARDISGKQFCEKYKGSLVLEGVENRLYIKDINWDLVTSWVK